MLGLLCAVGVVVVTAVYAGVLGAGFMSLSSPNDPIGDPYFPILETLILLLMPLLVGLAVANHAWTSADRKSLSLLAVAFTIAQAVLTTSVHFVILAVGWQPAFLALPQTPLLLSFLVHVLDERLGGSGIRSIPDGTASVDSGGCQRRAELGRALARGGGSHNCCARAAKCERYGPTDAARSTGDQRQVLIKHAALQRWRPVRPQVSRDHRARSSSRRARCVD